MRLPRLKHTQHEQVFRNNGFWIYAQVGINIFFYQTETKNAGILRNNGRSKFKREYVADTLELRRSPAICAHGDRYIWLTGGKHLASTERYDIRSGEWKSMPAMQDFRFDHASCCLGKRWIYVMCGSSTTMDHADTIERLNLRKPTVWEVLNIPYNRQCSLPTGGVVATAGQVGKHEIAILCSTEIFDEEGGYDDS